MDPTKRILVPIDFTRGSRNVIDLAVMLARSLDTELVVLHVIDPPDPASTIVPGADLERDAASSRDFSDRGLAEVRDELARAGFTRVATHTEVGDPLDVILSAVRRADYALIVMGTHGRQGLSRLLQSSVAEHVVRGAKCPVVTVHLPPEDP